MNAASYEIEDGRLTRVVDRTGFEWAWLAWFGDELASLDVPRACVLGEVSRDELLGDAHDVLGEGEPPVLLTRMSAIDWVRPTEIPAIAAPGKLPAGSGVTIMNTIALLAKHAGVPALRYAGPYPTSALWRTLARSFRCTATEEQFTADLVGRMARLARDSIAIDFVPAPFEQVAIGRDVRDNSVRGWIELRDGVQRVVLDGVTYEPGGSPARLVDNRAEIWFGDTHYATVAMVSEDGLLDRPRPIPACTSDVVGKQFPPYLVEAIAELLGDFVPAPLAADARAFLAGRAVFWADLGARVAAIADDRILVHAAIWQHVLPHGRQRLVLALVEALVPVVTQAVVARIATRGTVPA
jgi:hypothetical protein